MYTSLLLSGISILAFSGIGVATHRIACEIQSDFTVDLTGDKRALFHGSNLTIKLNENALVVNSHEGTLLHIRTKENIMVQFKGNLVVSGKGSAVATKPERITQTYTDRLSGMAQLAPFSNRPLSKNEANYTGYVVNHCRFVLLPIKLDRFKVHHRIANEIHRLAESCLELKICSRIDEIPVRNEHESTTVAATDDIPDKNKHESSSVVSKDEAPVEVAADAWEHFNPHGCDEKLYSETVQLAINKIVDVELSEIIAKIVKTNDGSIEIPEINKSFSMGMGFVKTTVFFEAMEGTFRDLRTIRRTEDTTLSHDGMKFMASCEFGLTVADLKFNHYRLKYLPVEVNGNLSGSIDGAALKTRIAVDYNRKPCVVSVEYLNVTEFGTMTVDLTGLGPLNDVTSMLINWITKTWRDDIIHVAETKMRAIIQSRLSTLNCEKFRP